MKKKALLMVLAAVVLVVASIGGTLAWLTDSASVTNTFTVGKVDIALSEPSWKDVTSKKLVPGVEILKDPTVTVEAGSEACYIFVKVVVKNEINAVINDITPNAGWVKYLDTADASNRTYVFAYAGNTASIDGLTQATVSVPPTSAVFSSISVKGTATDAQLAEVTNLISSTANNATITVDAYAIQAAEVSSLSTVDAVWTAAQQA